MSTSARLVRLARRAAAPVRPLLSRSSPLSSNWGLERGTPVDRAYIEAFLAAHGSDIGGHVLEVKNSTYTDRFGQSVTGKEVLDADPSNPLATVVADLTSADSVQEDSFDCFVLTQTLQFVRDPVAAARHACRVLRPGGVLLATLPSIIRVDAELPELDRWRFTEVSCRELFEVPFGSGNVEVWAQGNFATAVAFLAGLAAEELSPERFAETDPRFPVVILVRAVKNPPT